MFRKIIVLSILFPTLAVAQPPIRDCRTFLLDMSALGFRAGICQKNIEQPEVVRLRARERECSAISAQMENCVRKSGFGSLPCTMNLSMKL